MFLRQNKMLICWAAPRPSSAYTAEVGRVTARRASAAASPRRTGDANHWQDLTERLRPLAGMEAARLVAAAAAYVAAANGVVHPGEIELLRALRETLGLARATEVARA
jgi:tellurite resistance protein